MTANSNIGNIQRALLQRVLANQQAQPDGLGYLADLQRQGGDTGALTAEIARGRTMANADQGYYSNMLNQLGASQAQQGQMRLADLGTATASGLSGLELQRGMLASKIAAAKAQKDQEIRDQIAQLRLQYGVA